MSGRPSAGPEDCSYALNDFTALMRVVRQVAPVLRRSTLPRGRLRVGAAYSLFIFSVADAIARVMSDNDAVSPSSAAGLPRLPPLASLTRQLLEAFAWFRFLAIQPESEDEAGFRFIVASLHAAYDEHRDAASYADGLGEMERSGRMETTPEEHRRQVQDVRTYQGERTRRIRRLKGEIKRCPFMAALCSKCQAYWTDRDIDLSRGFGPLRDAVFENTGLGPHIRGLEYDELSAFVHAAPSAIMKTFEKHSRGFEFHLRYFHLWSGCLAPVVQYMVSLLPLDDRSTTVGDRKSVDECCCHYAQFLTGMQAQSAAATGQLDPDKCPTCWLRNAAVSKADS